MRTSRFSPAKTASKSHDRTRGAGGERAEVGAGAIDRVHPDAVAEQGAATSTAGRVDGDHRDAPLVLGAEAEAAHDLVGERRLARAGGAGDAAHGDGAGGTCSGSLKMPDCNIMARRLTARTSRSRAASIFLPTLEQVRF